ncbi:hypothetical protein [Winogradskyella sp.]|uniref:hypothetical protein n=1 Tax=Winogradskyella sp. TaxID=1883156 RepID=UPI003BA919EC
MMKPTAISIISTYALCMFRSWAQTGKTSDCIDQTAMNGSNMGGGQFALYLTFLSDCDRIFGRFCGSEQQPISEATTIELPNIVNLSARVAYDFAIIFSSEDNFWLI